MLNGGDRMNRFRELRNKKGLSQRGLAEKLKVSQTAVSQWETGRTYPDVPTMIHFAELCGVSLDYLLGRTEHPLSIIPRETPYVEVTPFEKRIIETYRVLPEVEQMMICRMLKVEHPAEARSKAKNA